MYRYIFFTILTIFLAGCSSKLSTHDGHIIKEKNIQEENFTKRDYTNISKDAIFEAAKKVFLLAGEKEFRIDSYRDKLVVSRTKMNHYPFIAYTHEYIWELSIDEENNISKAKLELYKINDHREKSPEYVSKNAHDLLWGRIDYLLGLSDDWTNCIFHWDFTDSLCDSIDMHSSKNPEKLDMIDNILIIDRKASRSVKDIDNDILKEDIELSIEDAKDDILAKDDKIDSEVDTATEDEKALDDSFDKEIEELDRRVNENIDNNLDKIENNIGDEVTLDKE